MRLLQVHPKAGLWFRLAADQGVAEAQLAIGTLCFYGEGVEPNQEEAAAWLRKAADQGVPEALYVLGLHYYNARDSERYKAQAIKLIPKQA